MASFDSFYRATLAQTLSELAPNDTEATTVQPAITEAAKAVVTEASKDTVTLIIRVGDNLNATVIHFSRLSG